MIETLRDPAASAAAVTDEQHGETVADARRLARKAAVIFVHVRIRPDGWQTACLRLTPSAFLRSIAHEGDGDPMVSKLYTPREFNERWLTIGH
jgi:hypothetical protein